MKNKYTPPSFKTVFPVGSDILLSSAENDTVIDTSALFL